MLIYYNLKGCGSAFFYRTQDLTVGSFTYNNASQIAGYQTLGKPNPHSKANSLNRARHRISDSA